MICPSCGMRQVPKTDYCDGCACPLAALAPPRALGLSHARTQRLPERDRTPSVALLCGAACAAVSWMPLYLSLLCCCLTVLCGAVAVARCRGGGARLAAWLVTLWGAAASVPALSAL